MTTSDYHEKVNKEGKAALIFVADIDPETGVSWCPDCAASDDSIKNHIIPKLEQKGYKVFYCLVGNKET